MNIVNYLLCDLLHNQIIALEKILLAQLKINKKVHLNLHGFYKIVTHVRGGTGVFELFEN